MAPKDTEDRKDAADAAEPMVDVSQTAVKKMIAEARERGSSCPLRMFWRLSLTKSS